MPVHAKAWFIDAGDEGAAPSPAELVCGSLELPDITADEVLVEPLFGCWEANMSHALQRKPIDICRARNEPRIVMGNTAVVRVLEAGASVKNLRAGQIGILFPAAVADRWGYPIKIIGYDGPGTVGCFATRLKLKECQVIPIPEGSRFSLPQWAAFSGRYVTAWSNWQMAYGTFRLHVSEAELPRLNVWGWGGGTTFAELHLARLLGHHSVMLSRNPRTLETIERCGIMPLDRSRFSALAFDDERYDADAAYRHDYRQSEEAFLNEVKRRTDGEMVHIFADFIGAPVYRATLKALSREGVLTTAGWKAGMVLSHVRAIECIQRHQLVNTHFARPAQAVEAMAFAERNGWMPIVDEPIAPFERIPELAQRYAAGEAGLFPVYSVNA